VRLRASTEGAAVRVVRGGVVVSVTPIGANDGYLVAVQHDPTLTTVYTNLRPPLVEVEAIGADAEPLPRERDSKQTLTCRQEPPHPLRGRWRLDPVGTERDVNCHGSPSRAVPRLMRPSRRQLALPAMIMATPPRIITALTMGDTSS